MNASSQTILDFLTLLTVEQSKDKSEILDTVIQQDLNQLYETLQRVADKPYDIADAILDWCEQHPQINQVLNQKTWFKVRCDMAEQGEEIPTTPLSNEADIVKNKYKILELIKKNERPDKPEQKSNP